MGNGSFKHITVTAAEDDDVVIHAGLTSPADETPESPTPENDLANHASSSESPEPEDDPKFENPAPENTPVDDKSPEKARAKARPANTRYGEYHPTTLDDLQGNPMPAVQKAVIIAAIVCIIGAIIYCVAFMR